MIYLLTHFIEFSFNLVVSNDRQYESTIKLLVQKYKFLVHFLTPEGLLVPSESLVQPPMHTTSLC